VPLDQAADGFARAYSRRLLTKLRNLLRHKKRKPPE